MKLAHLNNLADWQSEGLQSEKQGDAEKAIAIYKAAITENPLRETAYNRLMILYRKAGNYRKELAIIKAGISAFEKSYNKKRYSILNTKVRLLSAQLNKSTGLSGKTGKPAFLQQPLARWNSRLALLLKKVNAASK